MAMADDGLDPHTPTVECLRCEWREDIGMDEMFIGRCPECEAGDVEIRPPEGDDHE